MTKADKSKSLNLVSYNVHGLENKIQDRKFIQYLKCYDIFILLETHVRCERLQNFEDNFHRTYTLYWTPAFRCLRGRGIGGSLVAVKKELKHQMNQMDDLQILKLFIKPDFTLNIIPLYIRGATWKKEFSNLKEAFEGNRVEKRNTIIMGDLNIRLGELRQELGQLETSTNCLANRDCRKSEDKTRPNQRGTNFLEFCKENKLIILNGVTYGDKQGRITFRGARGKSANDIAAVAENLIPLVQDFRVETENEQTIQWSDHLPICLQINPQAAMGQHLATSPKKAPNVLARTLSRISHELEQGDSPDFMFKKLSKILNGFHQIYSRLDTVYNLSAIVHLKLNASQKVYAFFVHFKPLSLEKSYHILEVKLTKMGVSSTIIKQLQSFYHKIEKSKASEIIFALVLNELYNNLDGGLFIGNRCLKLLVYGNQLVIFSDQVDLLQTMIDQLTVYCTRESLDIDWSISQIMVFRRGGPLAAIEKWTHQQQVIRTSSELTYLGVVLTPTLSFTKQIEEMTQAARDNRNNSTEFCKLLLKQYGAQIWGCNSHSFDSLAKILEKTNKYLNDLCRDLMLQYIGNIIHTYQENSLTFSLTKQIMSKNIFWTIRLNDLRPEWKRFLDTPSKWNDFRAEMLQST